MSTSLMPQTMAERPPFRGGPPIRTTFDGGNSGEPDPDYEIVLESSARLLKQVDKSDDLSQMLRLLEQRYRWVEEHLSSMRILSTMSLPPIRGFEMDSFLEASDSLEGRFVRMLDSLNDAIFKLRVKMKLQTCPFPLSEL